MILKNTAVYPLKLVLGTTLAGKSYFVVTGDTSSTVDANAGGAGGVIWWDSDTADGGTSTGIVKEISILSGDYTITGTAATENDGQGNPMQIGRINNVAIGGGGYNAAYYNYSSGSIVKDSSPITSPRSNITSKFFFEVITDAPMVLYDKGVTMNLNLNNSHIIYEEREGGVGSDLSKLKNAGVIDNNLYSRLKGYQGITEVKGTGPEETLFLNKANIKINSDNSSFIYTTTCGSGVEHRTAYRENQGLIEIIGNNSQVYNNSFIGINGKRPGIYSNAENGTMLVDGEGSSVLQSVYKDLETAFINEGEIKLRGAKSFGFYIMNKTLYNGQEATSPKYLTWLKKPIQLLGDRSIGYIVDNKTDQTKILNTKNLLKFDIGLTPQENKHIYADGTEREIVSNATTSLFQGRENDPKLVEKALGIYNLGVDTNTAAIINIGEHSYSSLGIYAKDGNLKILKPHSDIKGPGEDNSIVSIKDGDENIGIYANGGNIDYTGNVKIENGKGNKLIIAQDGNVTVKGELKATNTKDTISVYADGDGGKTPKITQSTGEFDINLKGNSTGIIAKSGGTVTIDKDNVTAKNIVIDNENGTGTKNIAIGILADTGGKVNFEKGNVVVKNGASGLVSTGANSEVNLKGGTLDYLGNGYALYTADGGKIDLSNSTLKLRGNAVAYETGANIISTGTKIEMLSNDAIGIIAKLGSSNNMSVSTLDNDISNIAGGAVFTPGTENGITYDKYKIAVVDGGNINIDKNIDKSGIVSSTDEAKKLGHIFYNNFQGQKMNLTVKDGVEVKAILDSSHANAYYDGNVIALEMSGSDSSTNRSETKINIGSGAKVLAGRTDAGAGAIGAFINYGELTNKGTIEVEKDSKNTGAVGIYGVNGSKVQNDETINVHGDKSIGIFAKAYREDNVKEFATDSGTTEITNTKDITLDGKGSIGIYGTNNNTSGTTVNIKNTGNIKVGDSSTDGKNTAVGIYGEKATIDNSGNIEVSEKGIGIYGAKNSTINASGTITLGNSGEGDRGWQTHAGRDTQQNGGAGTQQAVARQGDGKSVV